MSRRDRAAKGFVAGLFQYLSQILVQILLAPLILATAGRETLGAYAALMQALALLMMVNVAAAWSLDRFLAQASGVEDGGTRFREIFTTSRTILLITNTVYCILILVFSVYIARLFQLTPPVAKEARYSLYIIAVWAVLSTPLWSYQNALLAKQHVAETNLIATGINISKSAASLLAVLAGTGLFGLMMAGTIVNAVGGFIYRARFRKHYPHLKPSWGVPDRKLLKEMLSFGGYTAFMNVGNKLFLSSANMLASITSGAAAASTFYTTQTPGMTGYNLIARLTDSSTPATHELFGRGEINRLRNVFTRLMHLVLMMTTPLAIGIFLFNKDVVTCWVGAKMYAGALLNDTLAVYVGLSALLSLSILFSYVFGWVRMLAVISFVQGIANVGAGYYLGKTLGLGGITLALSILLIPQSVILLTKISRKLDLNAFWLIGESFLRAAVPLALAALGGMWVHAHVYIARHHFGGLIAECLTFTVIYAVGAYFFVMHKQDQEDTHRYLASTVQLGRRLCGKIFGAS